MRFWLFFKGGAVFYMFLNLNLEEIKFSLRISEYRKSVPEIWDEQWCKVDLKLQSDDWLNYEISSNILLACEIEDLENNLNNLINNNIQASVELEFIEPNLSVILNPEKSLNGNSGFNYVKSDSEVLDMNAEFRIHICKDGITSNYISLLLDKTDINNLYYYLSLIMGNSDINDLTIKKLIENSIIENN